MSEQVREPVNSESGWLAGCLPDLACVYCYCWYVSRSHSNAVRGTERGLMLGARKNDRDVRT